MDGNDTSVVYIAELLAGLATQTELFDQLAVAVIVFGLQVVKQLAALVNHPQQTLTAVVIFLVLAEVIGEFYNSLGQQCNLYFRRAGIGFAACVVGDNALLYFTGK